MKKRTKFLVMIIAIIMIAGISMQGKVFAEASNTKVIKTVEDLSNAILNQTEGETWQIQEGTYVLTKNDLQKYSSWGISEKAGQGNWYFPIHENNITIKGVGNVVITSDVETPNGAWSSQDFISIWADNVTIDGINIKSKKLKIKQ